MKDIIESSSSMALLVIKCYTRYILFIYLYIYTVLNMMLISNIVLKDASYSEVVTFTKQANQTSDLTHFGTVPYAESFRKTIIMNDLCDFQFSGWWEKCSVVH